MTETADAPLIAVSNLSKTFGSTKVLHDITLNIAKGEVLVLLGPNGAGKSTFLNIVGGTLKATSGSLIVDGHEVDSASYSGAAARASGIQRVFQELSTFANLSVAQNLSLTAERTKVRSIETRSAKERMSVFPDNEISVRSPVSSLSVAERQMVEIVRAITEPGARLVILDEPTSALSAKEAHQLCELVARKAREGVSIIYVTHKLEEALRIADRVVVFRDGRLYFDGRAEGLDHDRLLSLLGGAVAQQAVSTNPGVTEVKNTLLDVRGLTSSRLNQVKIHVCEGEVVGIAGLEGAGQRELLQAIFEARGRNSGAVTSKSDIAYVSGDRKREGLLPLYSVEDNVAIASVGRNATFGIVDFKSLKAKARQWLGELDLLHRAESPIVDLSGGNQQRALLGRALASDAPLLLLDDPTRGVDVSAKASIYAILDKVKERARSAILYTTEVAEFQKCDRVYVMARGCVVSELRGDEATEERIVHASFIDPKAAQIVPGVETKRVRTIWEGLSKFLSWQALPAAILMFSMFALAFSLQPRAFSTFGLELLLQASIPLLFAVLAQMLFLLGGDIDLGLGFAVGLANVVAANYLEQSPFLAVVFLLALILGYVILAVIVEVIGVSSVVATLGASFVWLGTGLMIRETPGGTSPAWLSTVSQLRLWPLPLAFYLIVGAGLLGLWLCHGWKYSVNLRALGHNRRTYVSLGYSPLIGRIALYALAGTFAVISGLLITSSTGAGNANVASGFTLATIAAVIVGGASFSGGLVSPAGAVMAVVGISLITTNLSFLGISSEYSTALGGFVLILALSFRSMMRGSAQ